MGIRVDSSKKGLRALFFCVSLLMVTLWMLGVDWI